jgi:hypothetical protein
LSLGSLYGFYPAMIPNLSRAWFSESGVTLATSAVTDWVDVVNGADVSQATSGNRPTLTAAALNGYAKIGSAATGWLGGSGTFLSGAAGLTVFAVTRYDSTTGDKGWCGMHSGSAGGEAFLMDLAVSTLKFSLWTGAGPTRTDLVTDTTNFALNAWGISTIVYNGGPGAGVMAWRENGTQRPTTATVASAPVLATVTDTTNFSVCSYGNSSATAVNGAVAAVLIYLRGLTNAEMDAVEGFLRSKYLL